METGACKIAKKDKRTTVDNRQKKIALRKTPEINFLLPPLNKFRFDL